jgi:hypothetical protein
VRVRVAHIAAVQNHRPVQQRDVGRVPGGIGDLLLSSVLVTDGIRRQIEAPSRRRGPARWSTPRVEGRAEVGHLLGGASREAVRDAPLMNPWPCRSPITRPDVYSLGTPSEIDFPGSGERTSEPSKPP